jgi:hypothetical protein
MHTVVEMPEFIADAKAAGITEEERSAIVDWMSQKPHSGDEIKGTGGARKVRFPGRGKGKSGGFRVIAFYTGPDIPVFLVAVFAKGDRIDLSQAERNELRKKLSILPEQYQRSVHESVQSRGPDPSRR